MRAIRHRLAKTSSQTLERTLTDSLIGCWVAGPLKPALLSYFALTSDHTQRLQGVRANGKFSSLVATPETPMARPDDLRSIVQNAKVSHRWAALSLGGHVGKRVCDSLPPESGGVEKGATLGVTVVFLKIRMRELYTVPFGARDDSME
jgi:hypothetical protein